jgi:hypothetical protein
MSPESCYQLSRPTVQTRATTKRYSPREGYTADDAIALIRKRRGSSALCNHQFVAWLRRADVEA